MKISILVALSLLFLGCQEKEYSKTELTNKLVYVGQQDGPFKKDTLILKYFDKKLNIMCYMYVPDSVSTTHSNNMIFVNGFGGSMSCVKL